MVEIDRGGTYTSSTKQSYPFDTEYNINLEGYEPVEKIDHPPHYCRNNAMECIDELELIFGPEIVMHFCLCNVFKYRYRAGDKNGKEDIEKSDWYMKKYKEYKEKVKANNDYDSRVLKYNPIVDPIVYTYANTTLDKKDV